MASASCSPACVPARDLFCCARSPGKERGGPRFLNGTRATGPSRIQFIFDGRWGLFFAKERMLRSSWKGSIQHLGTSNFNCLSLQKQDTHLIKAVATIEPKCLVPSDIHHICDSDLQIGSNSDSQVLQPAVDDLAEVDEREKLRRTRISKANRGNVPWNKGRKHSAETLQRIRERTRLAMQDPKVKLKLMNLGHAQSEETRIKIGVGVREGWQRRRERLTVQEGCCFEWENLIADASRKGFAGEDELQWDSYGILDEQLKEEWLESVEKRKTMARPKGSKRAPKSAEQRKKISEAIAAKWAEPEYRNRVYAALSKYHGTPVGAEKKPRRIRTGDTLPRERVAAKKKVVQPKVVYNETKSIKKTTPRKKRTPSYKDPMAAYKLEMIKNIRAERVAMDTKKKEATERAKLLIAEAEKAAKVLEVAALKSPLAQASLIETRKLIAEAIRSVESIESGQMRSEDAGDDASFFGNGTTNHIQMTPRSPSNDAMFGGRQVNGSRVLFSGDSDCRGLGFDELTLQDAQEERKPLLTEASGESLGLVHGYSSLQPSNLRIESSSTELRGNQAKINGSIIQNLPPKDEEDDTSQAQNRESCSISATKTKKWVCGRLVEVED